MFVRAIRAAATVKANLRVADDRFELGARHLWARLGAALQRVIAVLELVGQYLAGLVLVRHGVLLSSICAGELL